MNFCTFLAMKFPIDQNSESLKIEITKIGGFEGVQYQNWFHVKSQKKCSISIVLEALNSHIIEINMFRIVQIWFHVIFTSFFSIFQSWVTNVWLA